MPMLVKRIRIQWILGFMAAAILIGCVGSTKDQTELAASVSPTHAATSSAQPNAKSATGFYAKENIVGPIQKRSDDIRRCYEVQLEKQPGLSGRIDLSWTIAKDGQVTELTTKGLPEVAPCVAKVIKSIRFLPPHGTTQKVSDYPFVFRSEN